MRHFNLNDGANGVRFLLLVSLAGAIRREVLVLVGAECRISIIDEILPVHGGGTGISRSTAER